jgi:hypothetical protein
MGTLTECNYCRLQKLRNMAKRRGARIVLRPSVFMGGICVFEVPKGIKLPEYTEPNKQFPNGCSVYEKYTKGWFRALTDHCFC